MKRPLVLIAVVSVGCLPLRAQDSTSAPLGVDAMESTGPAPLFIANRGQFDTSAVFVGSFPGVLVRAEPAALILQCSRADAAAGAVLLRWSFPGSLSSATIEGERRSSAVFSYFQGSDPRRWQRDVGAFEQVRYRSLHPGIDLVVRCEAGAPKYDVLLAPGADLSAFVVRCEGTTGRRIDPDGSLVLETVGGPLRQPAAQAWENLPDGSRRTLACSFRLVGTDSFGLAVEGRDPSLPLVVDPGLFWSTYLGGFEAWSVGAIGKAVAFAPDGSVTAVGEKEGLDFPQTPGAVHIGGGRQVFVTRLSATNGSLVYSATIGGAQSFQDRGRCVAVDALGRATVAGYADSADFPTTPMAWDRVKEGGFDAFVLRLNASGSDLEYSTFLGTGNSDHIEAMVLAPNGAAIVGGYTGGSTSFPTTPEAFDTVYEIADDVGFITRFTPDGSSLEWSTLLGWASTYVYGLAIAANEDVIAVGSSVNVVSFPATAGAWIEFPPFPPSSTQNVFVARFSANGSTLQWGALFGGTGNDRPYDVSLLPSGDVVVAGTSQMLTSFPTTPGVIQENPIPNPCSATAFVTRLRADGSAPVYSTLLGIGFDGAKGLAADASGVVTIAGPAWTGFAPPTPGAHDALNVLDLGITRIDPTGRRVLYSTALGGEGQEDCAGIAMTPTGRVAVIGSTTGDYPTTTGAGQQTYGGGQRDAFVSVLDLIPTGIRAFGRSTPSCRGPVTLNARAMPAQGASGFSLYTSGLPPGADGWFVVSDEPLPEAREHAGVALWVDLSGRVKRVPFTASADGFVDSTIPELVRGSPGSKLYVQVIAEGTAACGGVGSRCASNALCVTVQ